MKIGITIIATNSYIVLAIRFIKRFMYFYKGNAQITFYVFTDEDIKKYIPENINIIFIETHHKNWVDGTDSKFLNITSIENYLLNEDFVLYVDADTNINQDFTEDWFLGDSVAGQHYGDAGHMKTEGRPFDRNPRSMAYIPFDTTLPQIYTYGAFWGGTPHWIVNFCKKMIEWQIADRSWGYEPAVNDESYSNKYFHFNPPTKVVMCPDFKFAISDKGGIGETRRMDLNVDDIKKTLFENKDDLNINILNGVVTITI